MDNMCKYLKKGEKVDAMVCGHIDHKRNYTEYPEYICYFPDENSAKELCIRYETPWKVHKDNDGRTFLVMPWPFNRTKDLDFVPSCTQKGTMLTELDSNIELIKEFIKNPTMTDEKQVNAQEEIINFCEQFKKILLEKNKRYGNSALEPIRVASKLSPEQGILLRIDDKIKRIRNSESPRKNDFIDLAGYIVLLAIEKDWMDLSDLID